MSQNIQLNLKAPVVGVGEVLLPGSSASTRRSLLAIWPAGLDSSRVLWTQEGRELPRTRADSPGSKEQSRGKAVGRGGGRNKMRACLREQTRTPSSPLSLESCKAREPLDLKAPGGWGGRQTRRRGRVAGEGEDPGVGWKDGQNFQLRPRGRALDALCLLSHVGVENNVPMGGCDPGRESVQLPACRFKNVSLLSFH